MRTRLSLVFFIGLAAVALSAQSGQPPRDPQEPSDQRPPVFRAETNYILVDMYAHRDGRFVDDLRADEVEVFEDGVRQRIDTFEHVRIGGESDAPRRDADNEELAESRSRVFVVFVDTFTTPLEREPGLRLRGRREPGIRPPGRAPTMVVSTPVAGLGAHARIRSWRQHCPLERAPPPSRPRSKMRCATSSPAGRTWSMPWAAATARP